MIPFTNDPRSSIIDAQAARTATRQVPGAPQVESRLRELGLAWILSGGKVPDLRPSNEPMPSSVS